MGLVGCLQCTAHAGVVVRDEVCNRNHEIPHRVGLAVHLLLHEPSALDLDDLVFDDIGQIQRFKHVLQNVLEFDSVATQVQGDRLVRPQAFLSDRWFVDQNDQTGHLRDGFQCIGQRAFLEGS